uniref:Uncharacterized protein n=1 Tax=Anguilla anguilla TaxID=7936 RepID=A0A0E9QXF0_ANGAN
MTTRQMNMKHKWKIKSNVRVLVVNVHFMIDIINVSSGLGSELPDLKMVNPPKAIFPSTITFLKK